MKHSGLSLSGSLVSHYKEKGPAVRFLMVFLRVKIRAINELALISRLDRRLCDDRLSFCD
jgi:hypothetical protein